MAGEQQHVSKKRNHMVSEEEEHRPLISKRKTKKRKKKNNSSTISSSNIPPDHILFEILLMLPVKSLLRCKSVCKLWLTIISDPGFVAAHLDRAKTSTPKLAVLPLVRSVDWHITVYSYEEGSRRADFLFKKKLNIPQGRIVFFLTVSGDKPESDFFNPNRRLAVPQHSNGLFLLETVSELSVFNPSTRQVITLPPAHERRALVTNMAFACGYGSVERAGLGFDSYSGVYKVARYFNRENPEKNDLGFEVFTLGVDSSWRVIKDAPYRFSTDQSPVSVGGGIYYLIRRKKCSLDALLLRFDVGDEEFTVLPSPPLVTPIRYTRFYMAEMEGILVLSTFQRCKETEKMDMWKLVEGRTWVHSFSIDLFPQNVGGPSDFRPVAMRQGKLLLQIKKKKNKDAFLAFYDPRTKSVEKTVRPAKDLAFYNHRSPPKPRYFREEGCTLFQVVSYVESLVSWETNCPQGKGKLARSP